jgi:uncharacterized delta-60 repeat protein
MFHAVALQPDGKMVLTGPIYLIDQAPLNSVRFNADGTLDTGYGSGGMVAGNWAEAVTVQPDGKIVTAGSLNGNFYVARYNSDGSPDAGMPLHVLGGSSNGPAEPVGITEQQIQSLLAEAVTRWVAAGADPALLSGVTVQVTDLPGTYLGMGSDSTILLDHDAAGHGWFVDPTPADDSEFTTPGDQGEQGRMDLLTVLMHELGHALGLEHSHDGGLMGETLTPRTRLLPEVLHHDDAAVAPPQAHAVSASTPEADQPASASLTPPIAITDGTPAFGWTPVRATSHLTGTAGLAAEELAGSWDWLTAPEWADLLGQALPLRDRQEVTAEALDRAFTDPFETW